MKILVFSDIHGDFHALDRLLDIEAGLYFAAGDLVSWARGLDRVGEALARHAGRVHVLPGNHESEQLIDAMCRRFGLDCFHGKTMQAGAFHIAGLGYSNPTPFNTPGEYSEKEMAHRLAPFAKLRPLVLVCHCPPKNTPLDRAHEGMHAGSQAVRDFIDKHQPDYFFCGHIHEAEGVSATLGRTRAVNTGKKGYLLDFDRLAI